MNWFIPGAAFFILVISLTKDWGGVLPRPTLDIGRGLWLLLSTALGAIGVFRFGSATEFTPLATMLVVATVVSWFAASLDDTSLEGNGTILLSIAAFLGSIWQGGLTTYAQLAALVGVGLSALVIRSATLGRLSVILTALVAADALGRAASVGIGIGHAGSVVAVSFALVTFAVGFIKVWPTTWLKSLICGLAAGVLGYLIAERVVHLHESAICAGLGALVAWISDLALDSEETGVGRRTLVGVMWIAVSTVCFGFAHGFGIAICLAVGGAYFAMVQCDAGLLCLGPALGLAIVRVLRELHPDASRALDLGQHYAIVGLAVGLAVPLLVNEIGGTKKSGLSGIGWAILAMMVPAISLTLTGAKGAYGLVVGLGLASLFSFANSKERLLPVAIGSAVGAISILEYGWLSDWFSKSRNDKLHLAVWLVGACIVGILLIVADARRTEVKA